LHQKLVLALKGNHMLNRNQVLQKSSSLAPPRLVGILNLTPDSFSDGGRFNAAASALAYAEKLINDGADGMDIGAESTRPGAVPLSHIQEWQRLDGILQPVINLCRNNNVVLSVDTRHPATAKKAIELGANWINDVSGFESVQMIDAVKNSGTSLVFMHNLGVPADKNIILPAGADPVALIIKWAAGRISELEKHGVDKSRLIFDPGLGFGKDATQSWEIVNRIQEFKILGVKILVGHSRKSFLNATTLLEKDSATLALSINLAQKGVDYLRVHDVVGHRWV
jgi:dihydropteroate synthase